MMDIGNVCNTGVFVLEPNKATYTDMLSKYKNTYSYNKGDQGFLNSYFNTCNPIPLVYNVMPKFQVPKSLE